MDADLADMQSLGKYNKGIKYLVCVIGLFSKYPWGISLKDKRRINIANAFQKLYQKDANQIKYGLTKVVNFTISFLRRF